MSVLKCKMCSGQLNISNLADIIVCPYCGTQQTIPTDEILNEERFVVMLDRANAFRKQCEFDLAYDIYQDIASDFPYDPEIFWNMVLCRYGVEYIKDPQTDLMIPTCHRIVTTPILKDPNYLQAVNCSKEDRKRVYRWEAEKIENVQRKIIAISNNEEPFDVFICYKDLDEFGVRTEDSMIAQQIYELLKNENLKVFFSRVTLSEKLGTEYEPYIYSALNSSKVMIVVGTKAEYFNSTWVRNEWSRFFNVCADNVSKKIIPVYKNMKIDDLPERLASFQAVNTRDKDYLQRIRIAVLKIVDESFIGKEDEDRLVVKGFNYLQKSEWEKAEDCFVQVLNVNSANARAYLGRLMADMRFKTEIEIEDSEVLLEDNKYYKNIIQYADYKMRIWIQQINLQISKRINAKNLPIYKEAYILSRTEELANNIKAYYMFSSLGEWRDAKLKASECLKKIGGSINPDAESVYAEAQKLLKSKNIDNVKNAKVLFESIVGWKDAESKAHECDSIIWFNDRNTNKQVMDIFAKADDYFERAKTIDDYERAKNLYNEVREYKAAITRIHECEQIIEDIRSSELEQKYAKAKILYQEENVESIKEAQKIFIEIKTYKDSEYLLKECDYKIEMLRLNEQIERFSEEIVKINETIEKKEVEKEKDKKYDDAKKLISRKTDESLTEANRVLTDISGNKDLEKPEEQCNSELAIRQNQISKENNIDISKVKNEHTNILGIIALSLALTGLCMVCCCSGWITICLESVVILLSIISLVINEKHKGFAISSIIIAVATIVLACGVSGCSYITSGILDEFNNSLETINEENLKQESTDQSDIKENYLQEKEIDLPIENNQIAESKEKEIEEKNQILANTQDEQNIEIGEIEEDNQKDILDLEETTDLGDIVLEENNFDNKESEKSEETELKEKQPEVVIAEEKKSKYELAYIMDFPNGIPSPYAIYYLFDEDEKVAITFILSEGESSPYIQKGSYTGEWNSGITINWKNDGYTEKIKRKNKGDDSAIVSELDGYETKIVKTDVSKVEKYIK